MSEEADKLKELEAHLLEPDFWSDKAHAQSILAQIQEVKDKQAGKGKYDSGGAIVNILAGAGGDDAEDFVAMLYHMYYAYIKDKGWGAFVVHEHETERGGYRNISFEVEGKNVYGTLKYESGVHRLVRMSPFNAKSLRHTSFAMVEVIPKFQGNKEVELRDDDLKIEFSRSSGPGGQNVNKRETAVRVVHLPTKFAASVEDGRSQAHNKEKALDILRGKLYKKQEEDRKKEEQGLQVSKSTEIEWGNQIRSYVLHPYKMVKDHRTNVEVRDVDAVLKDGELDNFITAMREQEN